MRLWFIIILVEKSKVDKNFANEGEGAFFKKVCIIILNCQHFYIKVIGCPELLY